MFLNKGEHMAKNMKMRQFIKSASDAPTRTMSVRVSNDLFERVTKARKSAKARGAAIDINQACAERIAELLDEYDRWLDEQSDDDDDAPGAVSSDADATAAEPSDTNTSAIDTAASLGFKNGG